ncbi:formylmethanofuran--tetrahydromethanopterin N-formyltransferase [Azospirillum lipoferum]|uniref:Formylmethanofuran--tetrahydromethanopterin formyltransferase n=1 Tax=Azospirillum lipoferum TaxID=193 RepID=A0A5A9GIJ6_AZOLI|nr:MULTISPECIES: formylmethanofuran--tetrahydromethanopterin N-formyltransferase [Azospirillum]KAA0594318.1 formylmethanofuran--tetrahydromethanopterin N-formyltransferase [Azospirillum lipoferum]MCP1613041.1 formylmethanofuran--tetrahydromethanopterin N-formyltransferase [Azospirillum lipoferum]MDW5531241.1 formylmethanofuran--tetrahydromethanopterin N-formyltransferase [Azospirillum sp. NL1]
MLLNGIHIENSYAEAFDMKATRLIVTADTLAWARHAGMAATGFATSVIACGCEAGIERELAPEETPDGRPGVALLFFATGRTVLGKQVETRLGQCILTCPGTACFSGVPRGAKEDLIPLGRKLRYFGDGQQMSKLLDGRRYWRIPVMDGEFLCEESSWSVPAVGGGNLLILADARMAALEAAEAAADAMRAVPNVVLPFPGGVVRSGSKVGAKYKGMPASTNDAYCPTLRGLPRSRLPAEVESVLEIVIDGLTAADVAAATTAGLKCLIERGRGSGVWGVTAGNYGGKLGRHHFHLHELLP